MRIQVGCGDVFGGWIVCGKHELRYNEWYYRCVHTCGAQQAIRKSLLLRHNPRCDTCYASAKKQGLLPAPQVRHGMTKSLEFSCWQAMRARCYRKAHAHYAAYGGRGITVCAAWNTSFEAFLADMGRCPYPDGSIDRIDCNGNYEPSNCRWVRRPFQAKNRRNVPIIEGRTLPELAAELGVKYTTLRRRISAGWDRSRWALTPQEAGTRH